MSLINDALKRAETEKLSATGESPEGSAGPTGAADQPPPPGDDNVFGADVELSEPSEPARRGPSPRVLLAVVLMLAAAGLAAYSFWMPERRTTPKKAAAVTGTPKVTPARAEPKASKPKAAVTLRGGPDAARPGSRGGNLGTPVRPDKPSVAHRALEAALAGAKLVMSKIPPIAAHGGRRTATTLPGALTEPEDSGARPRTGGKTAGPPTARVVPARPVAPRPAVDVSQYKVTGIMSGPSGSTAIINGQLYTAGQKIGQARVVKITRYSVVLEIGGRRVTVGM